MTDRKAFEAWAQSIEVQLSVIHNKELPRIYDSALTSWAWAGWQAAIKQEREACANECDEMPQRLGIHCARAIRARSEGS